MAAELVIGARRQDGRNGDAARALAAGNLVKVFAFRGATHVIHKRSSDVWGMLL
jgi:hypothetical protein